MPQHPRSDGRFPMDDYLALGSTYIGHVDIPMPSGVKQPREDSTPDVLAYMTAQIEKNAQLMERVLQATIRIEAFLADAEANGKII